MQAPRAEHRQEARRRLIAAASEAFAAHGFASARVRDIAEAAAVNLAAVNYYFGGKEGLYSATVTWLAGRAPAPALPNRRGASPEAQLHRAVYGLLDRFLGNGNSHLARILAHEAISPTAHLDQVLQGALGPDLERLHQVVERLGAGRLGPGEQDQVVLGILGQCLLHPFAGTAVARLYPALPRGADLCRVSARHITDMTLAGLERLRARRERPA